MDLADNVLRDMPDGARRRAGHCRYCGDTGWVDLAGSVVVAGVRYERGVTSCKWCEEGVLRYTKFKPKPGDRPLETAYDEGDLLNPPAPGGDAVPITLDQYAKSERGRNDADLVPLVDALKGRRRVRKDELPARVGGDPQPLTASVTAESDLLTPRKAEA